MKSNTYKKIIENFDEEYRPHYFYLGQDKPEDRPTRLNNEDTYRERRREYGW